MKWYIAKCPTGAENNAIKALQELLTKMHAKELFSEFFVPYHGTDKAKRTTKRANMANYIFLRMDLTPKMQDILNRLEVMNLMLDENLNPITTSHEEIELMRAKIEASMEVQAQSFTAGQMVKVLEAPFEDFTATIEKVDNEKEMANVTIPILGRQISVELPFKSIKRITD